MSDRIFVKPVGQATIINTETGLPVIADGGYVQDDNYIRRRIADGDAIIAEAPTETTKKSSK